jgi:DNA-binding XRE family transcriptional regulator
MNIAEFEIELKKDGSNLYQFAQLNNVSRATFTQIIQGKVKPSSKIFHLCKAFDERVNWDDCVAYYEAKNGN